MSTTTEKKKTDNSNKGVSFCFTDYKPENIANGYQNVYTEYKDIIRGIAWGKEICPTTNREHNQAYIQLFKQARYTSIQKMIGSKAHFEVMMGSIKDNETYCSKEGVYTKLGMFVSRGFKTDLHNIKEDFKEGATMYDVMENYTGDFVRYTNGLAKMKQLIDNKKANQFRRLETTVLVGEAGSGKTSYVVDKHGYDNVFIIENGQDDKFLFDGYDGERVLLIDDFNGGIKYTTMLRILDGHKQGLNVKNGRTYAMWDKVYITSNVRPKQWYKCVSENLKRRIHKCLHVSKGNTEDLTHPWGTYEDMDENIILSIDDNQYGDM